MTTILLSILIALVAMAVMLQIVLFFRPARIDFAQALKSVEPSLRLGKPLQGTKKPSSIDEQRLNRDKSD